MNMKMAVTIFAIAQPLLLVSAPAYDFQAAPDAAVPQSAASTPQCSATGAKELTITCSYTAASPAGADRRSVPRIVLNRAALSFNTAEDSDMSVELTFSNESGAKITERRTVYLEIDDTKGQNHLRRPLPRVDFTKLEPGKPLKFQEKLLAPGFSTGAYTVSLWIPADDPAVKFDPAHNFLLSSTGVPDPATGLNQVAKFTAKTPTRRGPPAKQDP